jgi:hypothetical protein
MSKPKILEALGSYRKRRFSDENLRELHLYLFLCLLQSDEEMKRRGLSNGEVIYMQLAKPE